MGRPGPRGGGAPRRRGPPPLLRGQGRFLDDLRIDGVAHVVFVRSPHAHARVAALDVDAARKAPGVVAVVVGADVDAFPPVGMIRAIEGMVVPEMFYVADGVVRCQGTPVAAVVADSAVLAHDAAGLVRVEWTPLPGVAEPDAALAAGAPPVVGRDDNRCFAYTVSTGDPDRAFAAAHRVVTLDVRQTRLAGVPLEPRAVAARWEDGALTIWSSTQVPHRIRDEVARLLGLAPERVRVIAPDVGGGFGVKGGPYREEVLIPWLARRLRRPGKGISRRGEAGGRVPHRAAGGRGGARAGAGPGRVAASQSRPAGAVSVRDGDGTELRLRRLPRAARPRAGGGRLRGAASRAGGASRSRRARRRRPVRLRRALGARLGERSRARGGRRARDGGDGLERPRP